MPPRLRTVGKNPTSARPSRRISGEAVVLVVLVLVFFAATAHAQNMSAVRVERLWVDHVEKPLGLEARKPGLSWTLASDDRGQKQTAFQILVARSPEKLARNEGDVWDSGKVESEESLHISYGGRPLESRERYYWKVRVWDRDGSASIYSGPEWWEMGLLEPGDWTAHWISAVSPADTSLAPRPAPMFRKPFTARREIKTARLYISGLGYHEASLNGEKIGDRVLDPAATRYDRRVKYVVHDATHLLHDGENVLGVILGNGWYNQHTRSAWDFDQAPWRDAPTVRAQLEIVYHDGTRQMVATGEDWRFSTGPIVFDGIRNGEHYDARLEQPGWDAPGFDDSEWRAPFIVDGPAGVLSSQIMPPIRIVETRYPVRIEEPKVGTYVYDFGQNLTGWANIRVRGPAGAEVVIRYGERLKADGTLDQQELSRFIWTGETQTDRYILKGGGEPETWHPRFVYHGFQYAEVTPGSPDVELEAIAASVAYTDFESAGSFETSNPLINRIQHNLEWSYLGNYHGYPTDCPHREKIGWSGDAQLAAQAGLFNFRSVSAYLKWIDDFADEQRESGQVPGIIPTSGWGYTFGRQETYRERGYGPSWEGAYALIPWYLYLFTGDEGILERYYDGLRAYVDYLAEYAENHIIPFGIDDHKPAFTKTEAPIIQTGFYYECTRVVADMARILGRPSGELDARLAHIEDAYNRRFFDRSEHTYGNESQTSLAGALFHGLVEPEERERVLENLLADIGARGGHVDAGVVGTRYILNVLDEARENDVVYEMVTKKTYPGWGYWVTQGATTLWQDWDGSMSLNHIMFGSVGEWFFKALAGIRFDPELPGFKRTIIEPAVVGDLEWVRATHTSLYGDVTSEWRREEGRLRLDVKVPVNTTALVHIPASGTSVVKENGVPASESDGVRFVKVENGRVAFSVESGRYHFEIPFPTTR